MGLKKKLRLLICLLSVTGAAQAQQLDEHLEVLQPMMGTTWVGGYADSQQDASHQLTVEWESILGGKAVRRTITAPSIVHSGVSYAAEAYFYWDWQNDTVAFLTLNTRGLTSSGTVTREGDQLILRGISSWPDHTTEFRTVQEFLPDGRLQDLFYRLEDGAWVLGHRQVFSAGDSSSR